MPAARGRGGEEAVGARAAADEGDPAGAGSSGSPPEVDGAAGEQPVDGAGDVAGENRVAGGVRRHRDGAVWRGHQGGGRQGRRSGVRARGVEAPDPGGERVGAHRLVHTRVARPDDDEPRLIEVGRTGVLPCGPGHPARHRQLLELLTEPRGDHVHERAGVDERPRAADDGRSPAHHERPAPGEVEPDGQGHRGCSPGATASAMTAARVRPSSGSTRRKAPPRREVE